MSPDPPHALVYSENVVEDKIAVAVGEQLERLNKLHGRLCLSPLCIN